MIGHLDCSTGVSGDKFLGALIDAGLAEADLRSAVARLGISPDSVRVERVRSHGIAAIGVGLRDDPMPSGTASETAARHLDEIRTLIADAELPPPVAARAISAFERLADAEAKIHGVSANDVHFHEVGALDALLDIVGVSLGIETLGIETLVATPPALGGGTVSTSHGVLPVPAPATAELLMSIPTTAGPVAATGELTTPTGAVLLREFASGFGPCPPLTPMRIGYGAGTRDLGSPNVCRIILGEAAADSPDLSVEDVALLETNLDHLSPEAVAFACEQLLAEGALDVWQAPIVMKKGRAAYGLSVLCTADAAHATAARVVALTGSLGVRRTDLPRYVAERSGHVVDTPWGPVRVKLGPEGAHSRVRPENDDVARIARETGRAFSEVARELTEIACEALLDG